METLLCRRFDLARSSGLPIDCADPTVLGHLDACERCQHTYAMDQRIEEVLTGAVEPLPDGARRRVLALVSVKAREDWSPRRLPRAVAVAAAVAACVALLVAFYPGDSTPAAAPSPAASQPPPAGPTQAAVPGACAEGEPISGLAAMVARHVSGQLNDVPSVAVLYEGKLPHVLANQLLTQATVATVAWDGLPAASEVDEATLFVLDRAAVFIEPAINEVLEEYGTLTLPWGPHQVTIARRDTRLFLIVASPAGLGAVAGLPL